MAIKTEWIGPTVLVCKNVIKSGTTTQVLEHLSKKGDNFWENTVQEDEETGETIEDSSTQYASDSKLLNKVYEAIDEHINSCVEEYIKKFQHYGSFLTRKEEYCLLKFKKGSFQDEHVDILPVGDEYDEEDGETSQSGIGGEITPASCRKLSIIIFLNDDYEGGSMIFPYQKLKYKPTRGDVIIFDCGALHPYSCEKITKGKKFVINTWMY